MSMELVWVPSVEGESRADRRRRRRDRRRSWALVGLACTIMFGSTLLAVVWSNRPPQQASASEIETPATTAPIASEWNVTTTSTTVPIPEAVPTSIAPQWIEVRVTVPGWDGLGRIVTDGVHHRFRVLPGAQGVAVVGIEGDPASAQTVIVDGSEWRVFNRGQVAPDNLDSLANRRPIEPVVVLVSMQPGPARNYVEARK